MALLVSMVNGIMFMVNSNMLLLNNSTAVVSYCLISTTVCSMVYGTTMYIWLMHHVTAVLIVALP